jgi:hypothetical protein
VRPHQGAEVRMIPRKAPETSTNLRLPCDLRLTVDEVRLARARRHGGVPPTFRQVVIEALEALVAREVRK